MSSFLESCFQEHYPFYSKLTADEQQTLVLSSVLTTYQRGDFLYSCDDDCLGVLLVLSGKLRIFIQSGEQREITLFTTGPGEVCTLSASCAMQEISFDILIEAEEETKVLITPASTFRRLMNQNIYVENYIYRETTEHFSEVMWAMGQLLFTRLDQRLAGYLEDERIRTGSPVLSTTHEQIARNLGSAREVVSRTLKSFGERRHRRTLPRHGHDSRCQKAPRHLPDAPIVLLRAQTFSHRLCPAARENIFQKRSNGTPS